MSCPGLPSWCEELTLKVRGDLKQPTLNCGQAPKPRPAPAFTAGLFPALLEPCSDVLVDGLVAECAGCRLKVKSTKCRFGKKRKQCRKKKVRHFSAI